MQQENRNDNCLGAFIVIVLIGIIGVGFHFMWSSSSKCYAECYSTETQCIVKKEIIPKQIKLTSGEIINNDNETIYTIQKVDDNHRYILKTRGEQSDFNLEDNTPQSCYTYQRGWRYYRNRIPLHGSCYMKCHMFEF